MSDCPNANYNIHSLNPRELIDWCSQRCREQGISRSKLSAATGVPEGTLDRILTGKNPEFRYSTIQPIIAYLIGFRTETPQPDIEDESQGEYYFNTIEGYKLIVENKNHMIEEYERMIEKLKSELTFLKEESAKKDKVIETFEDQLKWMQGLVGKR